MRGAAAPRVFELELLVWFHRNICHEISYESVFVGCVNYDNNINIALSEVCSSYDDIMDFHVLYWFV